MKLAIERDPFEFDTIDDAGTRIVTTDAFPGLPELRSYFTIDAQTESEIHCTQQFVELRNPPAPEEDYTR